MLPQPTPGGNKTHTPHVVLSSLTHAGPPNPKTPPEPTSSSGPTVFFLVCNTLEFQLFRERTKQNETPEDPTRERDDMILMKERSRERLSCHGHHSTSHAVRASSRRMFSALLLSSLSPGRPRPSSSSSPPFPRGPSSLPQASRQTSISSCLKLVLMSMNFNT